MRMCRACPPCNSSATSFRFEKKAGELVQFFSFRRQRKWPAVKQGHAEKFLELRDLGADRRLLDAVGNVRTAGMMPPCLAT